MSVTPQLCKTVLVAALATALAMPAMAAVPATASAASAWVEASNRNAAIVLAAQAQFSPENASDTGLAPCVARACPGAIDRPGALADTRRFADPIT